MSTPSNPDAPRNKKLDCTLFIEMPLEALREAIQDEVHSKTGLDAVLAQVLRILSGALMSFPQKPEHTQRAVAFLDWADELDGLGPDQKAKPL